MAAISKSSKPSVTTIAVDHDERSVDIVAGQVSTSPTTSTFIVNGGGISREIRMTAAEWAALPVKDPTTLYLIVG